MLCVSLLWVAAGTLYPGAFAAAPLATRETRRSDRGGGVDRVAGVGLEGEALVERQAVRGQRRAAVGEHRLLRERGERLGILERAVQRPAVDLGDQAHPVGLARLDHPAGEDEVERSAEADDARQALGAAVDEGDPPAALREAERARGAGDAQVAPERQLEAAGQAPALDGGDGRLG